MSIGFFAIVFCCSFILAAVLLGLLVTVVGETLASLIVGIIGLVCYCYRGKYIPYLWYEYLKIRGKISRDIQEKFQILIFLIRGYGKYSEVYKVNDSVVEVILYNEYSLGYYSDGYMKWTIYKSSFDNKDSNYIVSVKGLTRQYMGTFNLEFTKFANQKDIFYQALEGFNQQRIKYLESKEEK